MVTIMQESTETLSRTNISVILKIDILVILTLICMLFLKELVLTHYEQYIFIKYDIKSDKSQILNVVIIPFLYIFFNVLIYKVVSAM